MHLLSRVALLSMLATSSAWAGGFETGNGKIVLDGKECKKALIQIRVGEIEVDCSTGGFIKSISTLSNLRWRHKGGWSSVMADQTDGSVLNITVKKTEFDALKSTMLSMMAPTPAPGAAVAPTPAAAPSTAGAPAGSTTTTITTTVTPDQQ